MDFQEKSYKILITVLDRASKTMKICVFCSANSNIDPEYFERTRELGKWIADHGHTLVYGGCNLGLMECVAEAAHNNGAMTIGVVPRLVEQNGRTSTYINVHVPCEDLSDRKSLMMSQADMFIALPGGIGTLDEIFTVAASATIGYHHKPMVLYNINGYWNSLVALLDDMQQKGMVRGDWHSHISVIESLKELNL